MIAARPSWCRVGLTVLALGVAQIAGCDAKSSSQSSSRKVSPPPANNRPAVADARLVPAVVPPVTQPIVVPAAHPDTISHASEYAGSAAPAATTESFDGAAARTRIRARLIA
ncbi:MAG: hypothetical protein KBG15_05705, partial [Kofleriaceae bacterium]|nr:hypothetical protein [Kofleriaceae bacterium]